MTPGQVALVKVLLKHNADAFAGFHAAFPDFIPAVDSLPRVAPVAKLAHELRVIVFTHIQDAIERADDPAPKAALAKMRLDSWWRP